MTKPPFLGIPPLIQINATTVGPQFVTSAITPDIKLESKTVMVVLEKQKRTFVANVFRKSLKVISRYSRDVYVWNGSGWNYQGKDDQKHQALSFAPPEAIRTVIEGIEVFTMHKPTTKEINRLSSLIAVLK